MAAERAPRELADLVGRTDGATSLLLLIAVPIVRGEPLTDAAIMYAVYFMIKSAAVCLGTCWLPPTSCAQFSAR